MVKWFSFKELLVINQWQSVNSISCSSSNTTSCLTTGPQVISYYSMYTSNWSIDFIAIVLILVGLRVLSFFILFLISFKRSPYNLQPYNMTSVIRNFVTLIKERWTERQIATERT